jgi:VWFA-related protein
MGGCARACLLQTGQPTDPSGSLWMMDKLEARYGAGTIGLTFRGCAMRRRFVLSLLLILTLLATCALAQRLGGGGATAGSHTSAGNIGPQPSKVVGVSAAHADDEKKVEFKSQTVLVQVPTVVVDKAGNHIHDLKKEDFKVEENGKEQKIAVLEEVTATNARLIQATNPPGTFSNVTQDGEAPRNVVVIALDTVNTPFLDQAMGRKQLVQYLADNLDSVPVLAMVVIGGNGVRTISGLTNDSDVLLAALKKVRSELPTLQGVDHDSLALAGGGANTGIGTILSPSKENLSGGTIFGQGGDPTAALRQFVVQGDASYAGYAQDRAVENTMQAFLSIAWSLSGVPGRKSLIWATGGFPFIMDSPSAVPGGYLSALYERAMEALNDAQVSVYPVDVRGLVNMSGMGDGRGRGTVNGQAMAVRNVSRSWLQGARVDTLKDFAEMTGGKAYYNSNDLGTGFKRAVEDSTSYYLIGYYLDTHNTKPGWRKLKVKVEHKDVEVRSRSGFLVTNATMNPELTQQADIGFALSSPFDSTGIPLAVEWRETSPDGDKKKVGFTMHLPATGVTIEGDHNAFNVDFMAQAVKNDAPPANVGSTAKGTFTAEALTKVKSDGIFYNNAFHLPPGDYQVKFVVRDNLSGRVGSVSAPLTVN